MKSVSLVSGTVLLSIISLLILGAAWFSPHDPLEQKPSERLESPSLTHPLGTDRFGRDVLARTLHGGQKTLFSSILALGAAVSIGLLVGLTAGMFQGSILDKVLLRLMDVLLAFPFMVLAMVIAALFGTSLLHLLLAVISIWWVPFARLARSVVLQSRNDISYAAAKVLGARNRDLLLAELLPKAASPVLVMATFELGSLMLAISALSFLGLGAQPPEPEWGSMLADGRDHYMQAPHILLGPAFMNMMTVFAFNLIGEGMRDRLDPYETPRI